MPGHTTLEPACRDAGRTRVANAIAGVGGEAMHLLVDSTGLKLCGKHIVPTERGLELFAVLERADPALVDPGVTAQLECLLDEVLVGRQEMMGAIDAVCTQAQRIIGRLTSGAGEGRGVAASLVEGGGNGPARLPSAADAVPAQSDTPENRPRKRARRNAASRAAQPSTKLQASSRRTKATAKAASLKHGQGKPAASSGETPLRIPFGNKEAAQQFGARYRAGGWYAPPCADLDPFRLRGWL